MGLWQTYQSIFLGGNDMSLLRVPAVASATSRFGPSRFRLLGLITLFVISGFGASPVSAQGYDNGCVNERAGAWDTICPTSGDALSYISFVRSFAGGVQIGLTPAGVSLGTTCDGAAYIVLMASDLYSWLPADVRSESNLLWADPYITSEVMGHSVIAATNIPGFVSRGNPVDVVFAQYSEPGSEGLFWRTLEDPNQVFAPGTCAGNLV
jgi:hypothetical protein